MPCSHTKPFLKLLHERLKHVLQKAWGSITSLSQYFQVYSQSVNKIWKILLIHFRLNHWSTKKVDLWGLWGGGARAPVPPAPPPPSLRACQVCSQVWCRPYLATNFGFFELRMFPCFRKDYHIIPYIYNAYVSTLIHINLLLLEKVWNCWMHNKCLGVIRES